jgi:carbamoyl-phosphate synthase small subunit
MNGAGAYVLLEDGERFDGIACGAEGHAVGEVVFTTGMAGYQESVSDPSFAGQLITFTYPHIGNYGVCSDAMESQRVWASAAIMRDACDFEDAPGAERGWLSWLTDCGVPAITDLDTRSLVRHIRKAGSMRGGLFPEQIDSQQAMSLIEAEPSMSGRDLARLVSPTEVSELVGAGTALGGATVEASSIVGAAGSDAPLIAVLDTGVKSSILRMLMQRGAKVRLHPCTASAKQMLDGSPDAVLLGNGPGDPAALDYVVSTVRELLGKVPVWGICLGHQMLCRALGLQTFKLPFGHRGANHPVKDLESGRVEITSQNHGFAVLGPAGTEVLDARAPVRWHTDFGAAALSHVSLYDRTVEGLTLLDVPGASVQYHPEAGPGPHDSVHFFDRMLQQIRGGGQERA